MLLFLQTEEEKVITTQVKMMKRKEERDRERVRDGSEGSEMDPS